MQISHHRKAFAAIVLGLSPTLAFAHPGHAGSDFLSGLLHPLGGADHVLVMLAVGLWAAMLGGRARWVLPASFLGAMSGGALLALSGVAMPGVETGITVTALALAVGVLAKLRWPVWSAALLVSACGMLHGMAHGSEMPGGSQALAFFAGFGLSTGVLHMLGLLTGVGLQKARGVVARARRAPCGG